MIFAKIPAKNMIKILEKPSQIITVSFGCHDTQQNNCQQMTFFKDDIHQSNTHHNKITFNKITLGKTTLTKMTLSKMTPASSISLKLRLLMMLELSFTTVTCL